jgi:SAM-dependent methyltransferase
MRLFSIGVVEAYRVVEVNPADQYATEANLRARQVLWEISPREPPFLLFPWVLNLANVHDSDRVLEVGCGNGGYLSLVEAVGLDVSIGMIRAARERATGPLICGDAQQLPFRDASFDAVLAPHMLYHVADREAAIRELRRVLTAAGRCVAVTNSDRCHSELVELVEGVVGHGWRLRRPADVSFSLENGADQLRAGFAHVERVEAPFGVVLVSDEAALGEYVASLGDHYEPEIAEWMTWDAVVTECRSRAARAISSDGHFGISTRVGAFVCHN